MNAKLFEAALGIAKPWFIEGVDSIDSNRFAVPGIKDATQRTTQSPSGCGI